MFFTSPPLVALQVQVLRGEPFHLAAAYQSRRSRVSYRYQEVRTPRSGWKAEEENGREELGREFNWGES